MNRKKIKTEAKEILNKNLWRIIKPYLIISLISFIIILIFDPTGANEKQNLTINFIGNILLYPLSIGLISYILKIVRNEEINEHEIYKFYNKFIYAAGLFILISIFVSLWSLLFIIPGLVASISYAMAPYQMADGVEDPLTCIRNSQKMMYGYKWDYFKFIFSFLGWLIIIIFTFWYVIPYIMISKILYYEELKKVTKID